MPSRTGNSNSQLQAAHDNPKNEFYTSLEDIEKEMKYYKSLFKGKIVFCNCDDPYESNFFKYFAMHFNSLGLKKLITTCYNGSKVQGEQLNLFDVNDLNLDEDEQNKRQAYKVIITEVKDENGDGRVDLSDVEYLIKNKKNVLTLLEENGDFRSKECIDLLDEADIVVTNPPFSLFREYIALLMQHKKKFLIIGNQNSLTCKDIFPLFQHNQVWLGASIHSGDREFRVPNTYPLNAATCCERDGKRYIRVKGVRWFTNLDYRELHTPMPLYKRYNPAEYPHYDNFDAIEVRETKLIPEDYDDIMGVPITFFDKYCPEQFEILGNEYDFNIPKGRCYINGKRQYGRIFIRKRKK